MDLPISWYWGPLPKGPRRINRNLEAKISKNTTLLFLNALSISHLNINHHISIFTVRANNGSAGLIEIFVEEVEQVYSISLH